jgi:hypothetical protein
MRQCGNCNNLHQLAEVELKKMQLLDDAPPRICNKAWERLSPGGLLPTAARCCTGWSVYVFIMKHESSWISCVL